MVNTKKLKGRLREKNMTQEELARKMGINPSTLNKKINNELGETLTIREAEIMKFFLEIPNSDVMEYFFNQELEDMQEK